MDLPEGASLRRLKAHRDGRGSVAEIFRSDWGPRIDAVQWNAVESRAGTLRGVHVHVRHADWLVVVRGSALAGLKDMRPRSDTSGRAFLVALDGEEPSALLIPPGVAHGFLYLKESLHVYGVSSLWDPEDETGCRWDDPGLGIPWPFPPTILSARDAGAGTYERLLETLSRGAGGA
jgi:dTDP-4-dehydrorhamnose 3,5-epimerase